MYIEYGLSGIYDLEQRTEEKKTETQSDFGKMTDEQRAEFQKKFEEAKKAGKLPEFLKVSCDTTVISCGECDDKLSRSCRRLHSTRRRCQPLVSIRVCYCFENELYTSDKLMIQALVVVKLFLVKVWLRGSSRNVKFQKKVKGNVVKSGLCRSVLVCIGPPRTTEEGERREEKAGTREEGEGTKR